MSITAVGNLDTSFNVGRGQTSETDFKAAVDRSRPGAPEQGGNAELDGLLRQLISILQPASQTKPHEPIIPMGPGPVVHPGHEGGHGPVVHGGRGPEAGHCPTNHEPLDPVDHGPVEGGHGPVVHGGGDATGKLLERVISLLNTQLVSGKLDPEQAGLVAKLLPLLEQKLVSTAQAKGSPDSETALLGQLVSALGGNPAAPSDGKGTETPATPPAKAKSDAGAGIGSDEMDAMIANANGQGPEVNFADYETA